MAIPALVGLSFDLLRALAAGHEPTLARLAAPELVARLSVPSFGEAWRSAARLWDVDGKRVVRARSDGRRGLVRFGDDADEALVLVYDMADPVPRLVDLVRLHDDELEDFGQLV